MIDSKQLPNVLERLGQDLRKSGYLIGLGFVGLVITNDNISAMEAITLLFWGVYCWSMGHICLYYSDKLCASQSDTGDDK